MLQLRSVPGLFCSSFLAKTPLKFLTPYFDPLMAVVVAALMLPENLRMLWAAIKDVFLFSPDQEMLDQVKTVSTQVLEPYRFTPAFFDIIRTGRFLWISVYFTISVRYPPRTQICQLPPSRSTIS